MAEGWILQTLFASLMSQALLPSSQPPSASQITPDVYRPHIHTAYGDIRGIQKKTYSNVIVDTFLGIPYASPPVGNLRFSRPLPARRWNGIRDASIFGNECVQNIVYPEYDIQLTEKPLKRTEDCLYLNIYKPVTSSSGLLPVMVWIHGGAYFFGAGSQYEGSELASKGVIVVTINYRLDIFGYLSNEDNILPGNYGMLDQVMALKWVKSNIQSFGGDPNMVTIFGESAGSSSVSLLVLSPLANSLFQRAIMESGTSLSPWAVRYPATRVAPRQMVSLVGSMVGCDDIDAAKKIKCLRNVDAEILFKASVAVQNGLNAGIVYTPVVETTFGFLPDSPLQLWTQNTFNHVDTIRGFNKAESGVNMPLPLHGNISYTKQTFVISMRDNFKPYALVGEDELVTEILQTYLGGDTSETNIFLDLVYAMSDIYFKGPSLIEANIESKNAPEKNHYVYEFDHRPSGSKTPTWLPAVHGDEIQYVFGIHQKYFGDMAGTSTSVEDQIVEKQMQTMWTNFAKYGTPTRTVPNGAVKWNSYEPQNAMVLKISAASQELSYKNHSSLYTFPKLFRRLDTVIPDKFVVG